MNRIIKSVIQTRRSANSEPIKSEIQLDFTHVNDADLLALAAKSAIIAVQRRWRMQADNDDDFKKIVTDATKKPIDVAELLKNRRQTLTPEQKLLKQAEKLGISAEQLLQLLQQQVQQK